MAPLKKIIWPSPLRVTKLKFYTSFCFNSATFCSFSHRSLSTLSIFCSRSSCECSTWKVSILMYLSSKYIIVIDFLRRCTIPYLNNYYEKLKHYQLGFITNYMSTVHVCSFAFTSTIIIRLKTLDTSGNWNHKKKVKSCNWRKNLQWTGKNIFYHLVPYS